MMMVEILPPEGTGHYSATLSIETFLNSTEVPAFNTNEDRAVHRGSEVLCNNYQEGVGEK